MGERLSLEAEDSAVRERLSGHDARVVDEELHGEVVSTVDHEIVVLDNIESVVRGQELVIGIHLHIGVDSLYLVLGAFHLGHTHISGEVNHLALQVAQVHHVGIYDTDGAHAGSSQIEAHGSTQSTGAHDEHLGIEDLLLTFHAHILQEDMSAVSLNLFFV